MSTFFVAFLPLFIAIDAIGILPTFLNMTAGNDQKERRKIVKNATVTALLIGVTFVFVGKYLFQFLGISMSDFKVAGGSLLFLFAIKDLTFSEGERKGTNDPHVGIVPIGMPLIAGPGVLTSMLLLVPTQGEALVVSAYLVNILIVFTVFWFSNHIIKLMGEAAAMAIGKLFAIFLGAIGVMMIRSGVTEYITNYVG
ncbi:MAG: MarC family protein [Bdellovibrionales bacterium]